MIRAAFLLPKDFPKMNFLRLFRSYSPSSCSFSSSSFDIDLYTFTYTQQNRPGLDEFSRMEKRGENSIKILLKPLIRLNFHVKILTAHTHTHIHTYTACFIFINIFLFFIPFFYHAFMAFMRIILWIEFININVSLLFLADVLYHVHVSWS